MRPKKFKSNNNKRIGQWSYFDYWRNPENLLYFRVRIFWYKKVSRILKIFFCSSSLSEEVKINFSANHRDLIEILPDSVELNANSTQFNISVEGQIPGHVDISGSSSPAGIIDDYNLFFRIIIANSRVIIYVSQIVGWIYFVAWSVSFYPQMIINFKRKSVVGLSFDFLALNFMGHTLYAIFNACLFFVPFFQEEYFRRFPRGTNPVELNDVFFSIHASIITA